MSGHKLDLRKATIARLAQLYPACFYAARQQQRPLKIGIRRELATLDLGIGRREIDSALAWYVNGICYLQSLRVGADRIGLDGAPAGVVGEADEAHAREKLAALSARHASDAEASLRPESVGAVAPRDAIALPGCRGAIAGWEAIGRYCACEEIGTGGIRSARPGRIARGRVGAKGGRGKRDEEGESLSRVGSQI